MYKTCVSVEVRAVVTAQDLMRACWNLWNTPFTAQPPTVLSMLTRQLSVRYVHNLPISLTFLLRCHVYCLQSFLYNLVTF